LFCTTYVYVINKRLNKVNFGFIMHVK
jgi:hypothetical protein